MRGGIRSRQPDPPPGAAPGVAMKRPYTSEADEDIKVEIEVNHDHIPEEKEQLLPASTEEKPKEAAPSMDGAYNPALVFAVVAFYWVCSLCVVFLNKYVMNYAGEKARFPFPLTFTWMQLLTAVLCMLLMYFTKHEKLSTYSGIRAPHMFDMKLLKATVPLALAFIGMVSFNNLCLMYVEITFYQVARSLTILFTAGISVFYQRRSVSKNVWLCCGVIFMGYALGAWGEVNFSTLGVVFGLLSSLCVALYSIVVKSKLAEFNNDQWNLIWCNNVVSVALMLPVLVISGEINKIFGAEVHPALTESAFWFSALVVGISGYLINIATFLQIKATSPLTHNTSATAKACAQTLIGWLIIRNPLTGTNILGILICIGGSAAYAYVRHLESMGGPPKSNERK